MCGILTADSPGVAHFFVAIGAVGGTNVVSQFTSLVIGNKALFDDESRAYRLIIIIIGDWALAGRGCGGRRCGTKRYRRVGTPALEEIDAAVLVYGTLGVAAALPGGDSGAHYIEPSFDSCASVSLVCIALRQAWVFHSTCGVRPRTGDERRHGAE